MSESDRDSSAASEAVFAGYLEALDAGQDVDFEVLVGRHPALADELRGLRRHWQRQEDRLDALMPGPLPETVDEEAEAALYPPRPPAEPGHLVDDFRLERRLGKGAMGEVWEAEQLSLRRHVALKLLRPGRSTGADAQALLNEAHAAGRVDHDGIVSVYAAGVADGVPWIAQQLVGEGRTLADVIEERRPGDNSEAAYRRLAELFVEIADAVHSAHEAGVLHRDLKPRNILIGRDGKPRVGDFGLAHVSEQDGRAARPGLMGTYAYMSPEQCGGDELAIDRRSDVFSLGAVLYEALTRRQAFPGDTAEQIIAAICGETPPDPRALRPGVPRDLALICAKALEKERRHRYQSMAELRDDLRRYLDHEPIRARPVGALALTRKWSRRHPAQAVALILGGAALLAVSLLLVREFDLRRDAEEQRDRADTAKAEAVESLALAEQRTLELRRESYLSSVLAATMNLERGHHVEARRLLLSCEPEHRSWEWHHLMLRADTSLGVLRGHTDRVLAAVLSGDGRRALTGSEDGTARIWNTATSTSERMLGGHRSAVGAVALSTDGRRAFTGADDGAVRVWDADSGEQLHVFPGQGSAVVSLSSSRDGHLLAAGYTDGRVRTWSFAASPLAANSLAEGNQVTDGQRLFLFGPAMVDMDAGGTVLITTSRLGTLDVWYTTRFEGDPPLPGLAPEGTEPEGTDLERGPQLLGFGPEGTVGALSGDGTRVLSGSSGGRLALWEVLPRPTIESEAAAAEAEALAESAEAVESADDTEPSTDDVVVPTPQFQLLEFEAHSGRVSGVALSADGGRGVSISDETDEILLWNLDPAAPRRQTALTGLDGRPVCVAFSGDGSLVIAGSDDGSARLWDSRTADTVLPLDGVAAGPVGAIAMSADGSLIAGATSVEKRVRLWDGRTGRPLQSLGSATLVVGDIGLSADGGRLAVAATGVPLLIWDGDPLLPPGERFVTPPRRLVGGSGSVSTLALSADGRWLATGSGDAKVRLWNLDAGVLAQTFEGHGDSITAVAITRDGQRLASLGLDGMVMVWEHGRPEALAIHDTLSTYEDGALAFDDSGRRLAVGRIHSVEIEVLDMTSGSLVARLRGSGSGVMSLALIDSGRRLVAGFYGSDALWTWDVDSGDMVAEFPAGGGSLWSLAPSADGRRMVTGDQLGTVRIWESERDAARALWRGTATPD